MDLKTPDYVNDNPEQNELWDKKYLLFLSGITAVFDGFKALDLENLGILHNELRVVIGPNGAGKSTMCDVITGKTRPTTGKVWFDGTEITKKKEDEIVRMGIGRKFQTPTVYDSLSVYENMELSLPGSKGVFKTLIAQNSKVEHDRIMHLLERVRLADDADTEARYLSHGQRQWLAISSLILSQPRLLLVDEPAAGLTDAETELTGELLLELKKDHTLIVIEHDMDFVRQLDSRVTVLCEGRSMAEGPLEEVKNNPEVIEAYLGR
ncbi:urea ABC transporter ATP-binding protein UrtD [Verrucomicrobia bacterium S94]|nr:urea ABC transporter ATP-binding protein UrtD [Verrucomicrobia bacterium S94]